MRERLYEFLRTYGLRGPFLLHPEVRQGKDLYRYDFDRPFLQYIEAQGCPWVTAHVMRHTFASLLLQANESIFKVARWMGDSVRTVERHYGHLVPNDSSIELDAKRPARRPARGIRRD
jgi:integrase